MIVTAGHLCSGYDGLGKALTLAGVEHETLWHAEVDPEMSEILKREAPDVVNVGDLTADIWALAPKVDLLTAGFPCQPVSVAGRQLAHNDPRWLWPATLIVIRKAKPWRVLLENVANIVSIQGGAILRLILADLRAAGYAARWTVLGACAVGAPHHRHRWFLVADFVGTYGPAAIRVRESAVCGAPRSGGRFLLPTPDASGGTRGGLLSQSKALERIADPRRSSNLDDAVASLLPSPTASDRFGAGRAPAKLGGDNLRTIATALLPTPRASDGPNGGPNQRNGRGEYDALPGLVVNMLPMPTTSNTHGNDVNGRGELLLPGVAVRPDVWGKYADAVALWEYVTGYVAPDPSEQGTRGARRMSALLPEWMMGLAPGTLTDHLPRSAAIKGAGNGVVPRQAAAAYELLTS